MRYKVKKKKKPQTKNKKTKLLSRKLAAELGTRTEAWTEVARAGDGQEIGGLIVSHNRLARISRDLIKIRIGIRPDSHSDSEFADCSAIRIVITDRARVAVGHGHGRRSDPSPAVGSRFDSSVSIAPLEPRKKSKIIDL